VKGDARSISIAAASIVAKVTRDELMIELGLNFSNYAWERNMGYGTKKHKEGLERFGVTEHHRKSYKPIINILRLQNN
jgi:ribonuclease HII